MELDPVIEILKKREEYNVQLRVDHKKEDNMDLFKEEINMNDIKDIWNETIEVNDSKYFAKKLSKNKSRNLRNELKTFNSKQSNNTI